MMLAPKERKFGGYEGRPAACTKTNNFFQGAGLNDPDRIPGPTSTIDQMLRSGVAKFFVHLRRFGTSNRRDYTTLALAHTL